MEIYKPTQHINYRSIIQHGSGNIDRYIYTQDGEGIGSFFGNLFKSSIPVLTQAIKGTAKIAKPHLKRAAADIVTAGSKRVLERLSRDKGSARKHKRRRTKL